jgi:hypothetical protein
MADLNADAGLPARMTTPPFNHQAGLLSVSLAEQGMGLAYAPEPMVMEQLLTAGGREKPDH